jgi:DNA-binding transcriptional MerR regulator
LVERTYLSIGDVLSLLKGEFPDITISKIRFLESQGLLDPERTPSGYRKFYEEDVDRLRWILRQQRENFLPLKVIKGRLGANGGMSAHHEGGGGARVGVALQEGPEERGDQDVVGGPDELAPQAADRAGTRGEGAEREWSVAEPRPGEPTPATRMSTGTSSPSAAPEASTRSPVGVVRPAPAGRPGPAETSAAEARGSGERSGRSAQPAVGAEGRPEATTGRGGRPEATAGREGRSGESAARRSASTEATGDETGSPLSIGLSGVNLTAEELAGASGLSVDELAELERYGLLAGRPVGDTTYYDEEALTVARLAAGFRRFGIEARHLRMYRTAADREASFFEQIVMPLLKQRNPVARRRAVDTLAELARLGQGLRGSLLRSALKDNTGG